MAARRKPMSAATKAKISRALKGKHHRHKGHPLSAAAKAKISAALKGKHHKAKHRRKSTHKRRHYHLKHKRKSTHHRKATTHRRRTSRHTAIHRRRGVRRAAVRHHRGPHGSRRLGTHFGARKSRLNKRPVHFVHHRRTTNRHERLARMHRPHPQRIRIHRRISTRPRRRR